MHIDVQKMSLKTPYRNDTLPIGSFSFNTKSLVMQGTSLEFVWSATVHRTTGRLTMAIVDREGSYIIFGQCAIAAQAGEQAAVQLSRREAKAYGERRHGSLTAGETKQSSGQTL